MRILQTLVLSVVVFQVSCSELTKSTENISEEDGAAPGETDTNQVTRNKSLAILEPGFELPECNGENRGATFYVMEESAFKYCSTSGWTKLELSEDDVAVLIAKGKLKPSDKCSEGGEFLKVGLDINKNKKLDAKEVSSSTFLCNPKKPEVPKNATVQSVEITSGDFSAPEGISGNLFAIAHWSNGVKTDITTIPDISWSSSDSEIVGVTAGPKYGSRVWFRSQGVAEITATYEGVSASVTLETTPAIATGISVQYPGEHIILGYDGFATGQVNAYGIFTNGQVEDITSESVFSVSDAAIASVSNTSPNKGLVTGISHGCLDVTATSDVIQELPEFPYGLISDDAAESVSSADGQITVRNMKVSFDSAILTHNSNQHPAGSNVSVVEGDEFTIALQAQREDGAPIDGLADTQFSFDAGPITAGEEHGEFVATSAGKTSIQMNYSPDTTGQNITCSSMGDSVDSNQIEAFHMTVVAE